MDASRGEVIQSTLRDSAGSTRVWPEPAEFKSYSQTQLPKQKKTTVTLYLHGCWRNLKKPAEGLLMLYFYPQSYIVKEDESISG